MKHIRDDASRLAWTRDGVDDDDDDGVRGFWRGSSAPKKLSNVDEMCGEICGRVVFLLIYSWNYN